MLTVDHFARIRQLRRDGLTIRADRRATASFAQDHPQGAGTTPSRCRPYPRRAAARSRVRALSRRSSTRSSPPMRRPRASSGTPPARSTGAWSPSTATPAATTRSAATCKQQRLDRRETFIPLEHRPGHACRGRLRAHPRRLPRRPPAGAGADRHLELLELPVRHRPAHRADRGRSCTAWSRRSRSSAACRVELWWDNPKTVAIHIFRGRERTLHPRYAALAVHYTFTPKFCMPATPTEKPRVENRVYDLQRQWATPVPRVDRPRRVERAPASAVAWRPASGRAVTTRCQSASRFEQDRAAALPVPGASVRRLRDPTRPGGQVPDGALRPQPLQRAAPVGVPRREREGVRRSRRGRRRRPGGRHAHAELRPRREDPRSAALPGGSGDASRRRWTTPRSTATGNCRPRSPSCVAPSKRGSDRAPAPGTTSACCNCSPSHPVERVERGDRGLPGRAANSTPRPSPPPSSGSPSDTALSLE